MSACETPKVFGLLGKARISGRRVFGVVLVAILADNGISHVYVYAYDACFAKIPGIEALML